MIAHLENIPAVDTAIERPALVFLVTLQAPQASRDWALVSALCERTLRSICNQTNPRFRAVLVCHEPPAMNFPHANLEIVTVPDLPLPKTRPDRMKDKWTKVRLGCAHARRWAPAHFMITDADDCVSRQLADHCARNPCTNGWCFDSGFFHQEGSRTLFLKKSEFHLTSGTSGIVHCDPDSLPRTLDDTSDRYTIVNHGHTMIARHFADWGQPLQRLPFPGAVYVTGTGENHSGFALSEWWSKRIAWQRLWNTRYLSAARRREYGLYRLRHVAAAS